MTTYYSTIADYRLIDKPRTISNPAAYTGQMRSFGASMSLTTDHDDADQILMFPIPTTMAVRRVLLSSDGAASQGTLDIGLCTLSGDGAGGYSITEVDFDLFASDQAIASAITETDVTGEAGTVTLDERFVPIWQAAGASSDPGGEYWLILTVDTADIDATTKITVEVQGVQ